MMDFRTLFAGKGEKAVRYMNKKYGKAFGDEFTIHDVEYAGFTSRADNYLMKSKRFPGVFIRVSYFERKYDTDYMEFHFYKQYQEYMQPICEEILGECKVLMEFSMLPTSQFNEKTKFEKFIRTETFLRDAIIIVKDDTNIYQKADRLVEEMKKRKVAQGGFRFVTLKDYEPAKKFESHMDWGRYIDADYAKNILKFYDYAMDRNYEVWHKGEGRPLS